MRTVGTALVDAGSGMRHDNPRHEGGYPMGEKINLTAEDGHKLAAYKAAPTGKPRGALVVIQEIFGVNHHIKNVTDGFAKDGYLAIEPAILERVEHGFVTSYQQADIVRGRDVTGTPT